MPFIRTVPVDRATGAIGALYAAATKRAGRVFHIVQLMSLQPKVLQASMGLYAATTTDADSPLPRWFRELIAVTVSRANHCQY